MAITSRPHEINKLELARHVGETTVNFSLKRSMLGGTIIASPEMWVPCHHIDMALC